MKNAVVLLNLGGPDRLESVEPFLFNLFRDPAIISLPNPFRWLIAKLISSRRAPVAQHIYAQMGGRSPILELTQAQAERLEERLSRHASAGWHPEKSDQAPLSLHKEGELDASLRWHDGEYKIFTCMRYWHPMSDDVVAQVKAWRADRVILLPLYPQYSTTTTGSSVKEWQRAAQAAGLNMPTETICCYPGHPYFIAAHAAQLLKVYEAAALTVAAKGVARENIRILFSAHGLPEKVIAGGDPYQWQVEQTVAAIMAAAFPSPSSSASGQQTAQTGDPFFNHKDLMLAAQAGAVCYDVSTDTSNAPTMAQRDGSRIAASTDALSGMTNSFPDHRICYQSRVGPMRWIGPSTDAEIVAAAEKIPLVIVPVAFVSEHSETLVELDIEYRALAERHGLTDYFRVPALGVDDWFIDALADMVLSLSPESHSDSKAIHMSGSPYNFAAKNSGYDDLVKEDKKPSLANGSQTGYVSIRSHCGARICPKGFSRCAME